MTKVHFIILVFIVLVAAVMSSCVSTDHPAPISFDALRARKAAELKAPRFLKATDGVDLAYFAQLPEQKPRAVLIFIHGGGAYSEAGYQHLAVGLSGKYDTAVYLTDLRGHGRSGGPRGDAPSISQVWEDLKLLVATVRKNHPDIPLYLGGHSSGGGLVLNYATWDQKAPVDGYFFIAPQLGYKSATERTDSKISFAHARIWVFVLSAMSGGRMFAHTAAVNFNYPDAVLKASPLTLKFYTRNMALAVTPDHPEGQFGKIDRRFGLFIGERDDLFAPEKVLRYADHAGSGIRSQSAGGMVPGENHLSILLTADDLIGKTILDWQKERP